MTKGADELMIIINTARRYADLSREAIGYGIYENNRSPRDVKGAFEKKILRHGNIEITTLNEFIVNWVGELISKGYIDHEEVEVRIHENGKYKNTARYNAEGHLIDFPLDMYWPED